MKKIISFSRLISFSSLLLLGTVDLFGQAERTGVQLKTAAAFEGYTLLSGLGSKSVYLINNDGEVVNEWMGERPLATGYYLSNNGELVQTCKRSDAKNGNNDKNGGLLKPIIDKRKKRQDNMSGGYGFLEKRSWDNELIWSYSFDSKEETPHHDIELMSNGNILMTFWEKISLEESLANGKVDSSLTFSTVIKEIKPIGTTEMEVVWEWHLWDHIIQEVDAQKPNYGKVSEHPEKMDLNYQLLNSANLPIYFGANLFHTNSLTYNEGLDQIMISSRNKSEIYIIDHSTTTAQAAGSTGGKYGKGGDYLFRFGNPSVYQHGTLEDRILFTQHDAQWIPKGHPNEGNIVLFNNGYLRPIPTSDLYSQVLVIENVADENGHYHLDKNKRFPAAKILFEYDGRASNNNFYSRAMGGVQSLPNGNFLIVSARKSRILEVTPQKEIVFDYKIPLKGNNVVQEQSKLPYWGVFKVRRYAPDFEGFTGRKLISGQKISALKTQNSFSKNAIKSAIGSSNSAAGLSKGN